MAFPLQIVHFRVPVFRQLPKRLRLRAALRKLRLRPHAQPVVVLLPQIPPLQLAMAMVGKASPTTRTTVGGAMATIGPAGIIPLVGIPTGMEAGITDMGAEGDLLMATILLDAALGLVGHLGETLMIPTRTPIRRHGGDISGSPAIHFY